MGRKASCRVLEKAGFQFEGVLCQNAVKSGQSVDMRMYAIIRDRDKPVFQDIKTRITEPEVGAIISYAALDGSPEGVAKEAAMYLSSEKLEFYGWVEGDKVIGICGFEVHIDRVEIHLISVAEDRQKQGIGGTMVTVLQKKVWPTARSRNRRGSGRFLPQAWICSDSISAPGMGRKVYLHIRNKTNITAD